MVAGSGEPVDSYISLAVVRLSTIANVGVPVRLQVN